MIWNPGQLPPDWSIEKLIGKHSSLPFNPDVANAFFRAGQIESWGRGIERIQEACQLAKVPAPEIRLDHGGLWVTFFFAATVGTQGTTQETTQERILALLKAQPALTRRELADKIGMTPDGIKYHLQKLTAAGAIRHVGPTKTGSWEVK